MILIKNEKLGSKSQKGIYLTGIVTTDEPVLSAVNLDEKNKKVNRKWGRRKKMKKEKIRELAEFET
jgi:hypothetical protein